MIRKSDIGTICEISSAGDKPSVFSEVMTAECHIPVIANGIDNDGIIGFTNEAKVYSEAVTVSARGNVGTPFFRHIPYYPVIRLLSLTPKDDKALDCRYLYYLLKNSPLQGIGSVQSQLTVPDVSKMEVYFEDDYETQRQIAKTLSLLDSKISNNNAICADLEAMAKLLYDYWFVQFDFPDPSGKPYKSSGGKMVWNEELKREIPEGWKVKPLGKVLTLLKDGTHNPPKRIENGIPLLTGTMFGSLFLDYSQATFITEKDYLSIHSQYSPRSSDIVLTKIGTLGNVNYLRECDVPIAIHCNSALLRFPSNMTGAYALAYCKSEEFQKRLRAEKGQSVQEFCSLDSISSVLSLVPDDRILVDYNKRMKPVLDRLISTSEENQQLDSLRDFLLPMLMNGQVTVGTNS